MKSRNTAERVKTTSIMMLCFVHAAVLDETEKN